MSHCHSFSLFPDTSILGADPGQPALAGRPPCPPLCPGSQAEKALLTGSLIMGGVTVLYKHMTLWAWPGPLRLRVTLALDQKQPVAGEAERLGLTIDQDCAGYRPCSFAPGGGFLWRTLLVPPSAPSGSPRSLYQDQASPPPAVAFPSGHPSLPGAPGYKSCFACRARSTWKLTPPKWPSANDWGGGA